MNCSAIAGRYLLLIVTVGCTAAFNLGSQGPLSSPFPFPSAWEGWGCISRRSIQSSKTTLFAKPKLPDEEIGQRKEQLRILLSLTEAETDQLVRNNASILERRDIAKAYGPKLTLLQKRLGITKKAASKLCFSGSRLLNVSLGKLEKKIDWLQAKLNLSKSQLSNVITVVPHILAMSVEERLEPTVDCIQASLDLKDKELTKIVVASPGLLKHSFSIETIASKVSFLQEFLKIEEDDLATLRKVVSRHARVLDFSEERMLDVREWMKNRFALGDSKCAEMFRNCPQLLLAKIETLEERANGIQEELELNDEELTRMVSKYPSLLTKSIEESIKPKVEYFRRTLALDSMEVKSLVVRYTVLLGASIEKNIEPKLEFYSELVGEVAAKETIRNHPTLLLESLKRRLVPRVEEVKKRGDKVRWTTALLIRLARRPDNVWEAYGLGEAPRGGAAHSRNRQ